MARADAHRARVEALCRHYLGVDELAVDADGDIPVRIGESGLYYVSLLDGEPPLVRVHTRLLRDVEASPELLERLNEMNRGIVSARVFWQDGSIVAATEVVAATIDQDELDHVCRAVRVLTEWTDELHDRFGGAKPYADLDVSERR